MKSQRSHRRLNRIVSADDEAIVLWQWHWPYGRRRHVDVAHEEVVVGNNLWDIIGRVYVESGTSIEARVVGNHSVGSKNVMRNDLWASIEIRFVGVVKSHVNCRSVEESRVTSIRDTEMNKMRIVLVKPSASISMLSLYFGA